LGHSDLVKIEDGDLRPVAAATGTAGLAAAV
jgi:hypothetical protein